MWGYRLALSMLVIVCWGGIAVAQELTTVQRPEELGFSSARLQRITAVYKGYVARGKLPGAVLLIARGDKIAYFEAIGYQDRSRQIAMKKDAIFRLASMTKPIVAVAALMLVEEGKLDLQAPVAKYLPEFKNVKVGVEHTDPTTGKPVLTLEAPHRQMTVQDLMRHTSGLVYGGFGNDLVHRAYREAKLSDRRRSLPEMITKLSQLPLAHQPGRVWEYGRSFEVLGRVIEVVAGKPLDVFIAERVTKPLGMRATDFYVHEADIARLAEAQALPPGSNKRMPPDVTKKPRLLLGGAGLVGSAGDYLRFAEMLLNGGKLGKARLLSPHSVSLMTADALPPDVAYPDRIVRFGDIAPIPAMGQGFGLGVCVRTAAGHNPLPGSVGTYYWNGVWGTTFWVDPRESLVAMQMIQMPPSAAYYKRAFRNLVYAALIETAAARPGFVPIADPRSTAALSPSTRPKAAIPSR